MTDNEKHIPAGYKPSPLGIIPEDWEVKRLGEIFTFKNGVNAGKDSYGEGVRFVNTMDVLNNAYLIGNTLRGRVAINEKTKIEFLVSFGDVLFNRTSETREEVGCSTVYLDNEEAVFGGFVIRAHDRDANILHPKFKQYCFQPSYVRNQISALGNGAIRYNLGQEDLSKVNLLIPTKAEQESIVSLISLWDTAISKQTQLIEKLTLRKRGLMQQLLTGMKRLKGFEGEWKEVKLGEIGTFFKGNGVPKNKIIGVGHKCLTYGDLYTKYDFVISNVKSFIDDETALISTEIKYGDICFAGSGETKEDIGKCAVFIDDQIGYAGGDIIVFRANDFNPITLSYILNSEHVIKQKSNMGQGHSVVHIYPYQLEKLTFTMPTRQEQNAIASVLIQADKEIELANKKLSQLQAQKRGLMQVLLTGKKRVK